MIIAVGSKNPAKVNAVRQVFHHSKYEVVGMDVPSEVASQPFSDEETIAGAINRAKNVLAGSEAHIGIGLEGGVVQTPYGLFLCNWGALVVEGREPIIAGGARIALPKEVANRLMLGEELGPVMEDYTNKEDVRKKEGAIGIFTNGEITRDQMFVHILKMLIGQLEFKND